MAYNGNDNSQGNPSTRIDVCDAIYSAMEVDIKVKAAAARNNGQQRCGADRRFTEDAILEVLGKYAPKVRSMLASQDQLNKMSPAQNCGHLPGSIMHYLMELERKGRLIAYGDATFDIIIPE